MGRNCICLRKTISTKNPAWSLPQVEPGHLTLSSGSSSGKRYELRIAFLHAVEPRGCRQVVKDNCIELVLAKAEQGAAFWGRLVAAKEKQHWLRVDFNRWKDEEETESEEEVQLQETVASVAAEGDAGMEELEGRLAGLGRPQEVPRPQGVPGPASWAAGLGPRQQQEWLVDCYRLRVDDNYALGGDVNCGTLYDQGGCTSASVVQVYQFPQLPKTRGF